MAATTTNLLDRQNETVQLHTRVHVLGTLASTRLAALLTRTVGRITQDRPNTMKSSFI